MKKIVLGVVFCTTIYKSQAQSSNQNYTKSTVPLQAVSNVQALDDLSDENKRIGITYFDGLSRPIQQIAYKQSPVARDIVQINEYDLLGRQSKQYLPYVAQEGNMNYKGDALSRQSIFYKTTARVAHSDFPFSQTVFDGSPLHRVVEESAPGQDWQLGEGHTSQFSYGANVDNEVRRWQVVAGNVISTDYYAANQLFKTTSTDPQGLVSVEFTNLEGFVVLTQSQLSPGTWASTYHVYNKLNQLVAVIPPQAFSEMVSFNVDNEMPERVYRYVYDDRGRVVEKKIPHKGWEYFVYDAKDRISCSQTANQRANNQWSFIKYDGLNRAVVSGLFTDHSNRTTMQAAANAALYTEELRTASNFAAQLGYTNRSFPTGTLEIHTVNYFDDYDFNQDGSPDYSFINPPAGFSTLVATDRTQSLPTGTKVRVLDNTATFLTTVNWFDDKARKIQSVSDNYLGGQDIIHSDYNFAGELTRTAHVHDDGLNPSISLTQRFTYDHAGRLKKTYHQVNAQSEILYCENFYNQIGQLIDKKLHSTNTVNPVFLQSIDYAYNIRGWLTHINNADLRDDEYVINTTTPGSIMGVDIERIDFVINEVDNEQEGHFLQIAISDQSTLQVEGNVNGNVYDNDEAALITLMNFPEEGSQDMETYEALLAAAEDLFSMELSPVLAIDKDTRLENLQSYIYSEVSGALEGAMQNGSAIRSVQASVFNYISSKAGFLVSPPAPFGSEFLQFYFEDRNGFLYLNVWNASQSQSYEVYLMTRNNTTQNVYDFLVNLTNDPQVFPPKSTPIYVDFAQANLVEGMGTMEAIEECTRFLEQIVTGAYGITHSYTLEKMRNFAVTYAINTFGMLHFNDDANDLWGMEIKYNSRTNQGVGFPLNNAALFNGNIAEITWQGKGDEVKRGYGYQYDGFNRLTQATYKGYDGVAKSWTLENNRYDVPSISYDLNGNIQNLSRKGFTAGVIGQNPTFGLMDNLSFSYTGDRLMRVTDQSNTYHINDFKDGVNGGNDYSYDTDGNLVSDLNKGLSIAYNHLNLPITVDNGNGEQLTFVYDATGKKLQKQLNNYGALTTTVYSAIGNYVSVGNAPAALDFVFTSDGRIVNDNGNYRYEYFYTDHLGNPRLGFSDFDGNGELETSEITQQHNYYPFGLTHEGTFYGIATQTNHKYLFNGKELQDEIGLNMYSMDFRQLDPTIGRWTSIDPVVHYSMSPYVGFDNNPIWFKDPSGADGEKVGDVDFSRSQRKYTRRFQKWVDKQGSKLDGISPHQKHLLFLESKNFWGRKVKDTRWYRNYLNQNFDSGTTGRRTGLRANHSFKSSGGGKGGMLDKTEDLGFSKGEITIEYDMKIEADRLRIINVATGEAIFDTQNLPQSNAQGKVSYRDGSGQTISFDLGNGNTHIQILVNEGGVDKNTIFFYEVSAESETSVFQKIIEIEH